MLVQLVLKNVLSFRDETVFTMAGEGGTVETVAGVYGANAAGKSNLVKALGILQRLVINGTQQDERLPARTFALDAEASRDASTFETIIMIAGRRYEYLVRYDAQRIEAESLFCDGNLAFDRGEVVIQFGHAWPDDRDFLRYIAQGTRPNQLFLTEAAAKNVPGANAVRSWFRELCVFSAAEPHVDTFRIEQDGALREFIGSTLSAWGTGARHVRIVKHEVRGFSAIWGLDANGQPVPAPEASITQHVVEVLLDHDTASGSTMPISFANESDGTRRLLGLLPLLHDTTPRTIVIDELDRSLHAALTRRFVDDFRKANATAAQPSQLIFTSHDTTLLTGALHKPEELWFAEKDKTGASTLYSLAEFKPAQLEGLQADLARGYLSGRFGAVPFPISTGAPAWLKGTGS